MRPVKPQRRSSAGFWLGLLMIVLAGTGGIVAVFWSLELGPWARTAEDTYMVRIPINARPIVAYKKVQREDLINPATGKLTFQNVVPHQVVGMSVSGISSDNTPVEGRVESVKDDNGRVVFVVGGKDVPQSKVSELGGALMNVNAILGRVVKKDKRAGMGFQESNFFPQGTPEGIAGATPPGMRAVTLDATKLTGIHGLNAGNRLDLLASVPVGSTAQAASPAALLTNNKPSGNKSQSTEPVLLARNAMLLRPVTVRNEATTTTSIASGKRMVNEPKYEVAIALMPDDVIPLQNALDKGLTITCVAASMQPETEDTAEQQNPDQLMAPVTVRAIAAYDVITREAFVSPATRMIRMEPVTERQVQELQLTTRLQDMLGSVARHDIPAGSFVRQSDLLQSRRQQQKTNETSPSATSGQNELTSGESLWQTAVMPLPQQDENAGANIVGDRPAVTSFIPPGRTAVAVPWNQIFGSEHLQIDDHLDLLASYPLERKRPVTETENRGAVNVVTKEYDEFVIRGTDRTRDESLAERGEPWFIATDAIVVGPVGFPPPNAAMRAIGNADRQDNKNNRLSGPAILLAVDTRDLESLATVLNTPDVLLSVAFRPKEQFQAAPAGFRQVAVAPVAIPAYSEFSDLKWKGLRRDITSRLVRDDDPRFRDAIAIDQIDRYYGRVLKTAKKRFATFSRDDFMPKGVTPGVAAGIGPDSVLVSVTADQVQALNRFRDNDRVALVLTRNIEPAPGAVVHATSWHGLESRVVVQTARVVRAASDVSDIIALEVPRSDAARLTNALFEHDAENSDDKHDARLTAIAVHRVAPANNAPAAAAQAQLPDFTPLRSAPQIYEVTGGTSRTHFFVRSSEE